ncbi:MAG TPA: AAA family ATPase [Jiangellaceae bacterium]
MNSPLSEPARPARVWVVAGAPGAGKSTVADQLVRHLRPAPALLDKDTLYGGFVAATLASHGREFGEREGRWYDENVKLHEYAGLAATAAQVRAGGCPVLMVAPFTGQTRDDGAWPGFVDELGGGEVTLVWVRCDAPTLRKRIEARGYERDAAKLADFDTFTAHVRPDEPPVAPHAVIDNGHGAAPLGEQLAALVRSVAG